MNPLVSFLVDKPGITALVDGQFGSTGKGVIASYLAEHLGTHYSMVTSNAGPNSGHTSYNKDGSEVILKQLPTFAVQAASRHGYLPTIYLNGGAVIDRALLNGEIRKYLPLNGPGETYVHPAAAEVSADSKKSDEENIRAIASTGQGVGPAIIGKLMRNLENVIHKPKRGCQNVVLNDLFNVANLNMATNDRHSRIFMEVSQGFSLGPNQGFYPQVTSRECTVAQALADAGAAPQRLNNVVMAVRTYPIRVGSTENSSGGCYPDQTEIQWSDIGVEAELTTVTKRPRRLFTWSNQQFRAAVAANRPDVLFINFMNYLPPETHEEFLYNMVYAPYSQVMGRNPKLVLLGEGPRACDVKPHVL